VLAAGTPRRALPRQLEHLARALVNGIILESRRCLDVLDQTRARRWDELWAAHEATRHRLHPPA
jgi:hypothetical protein